MKALDIEKRQCERLLVLYAVYNKSASLEVDVAVECYPLGLKNGRFSEAYIYLMNEDLLKEGQFKGKARLTHNGIKAIEWGILNPGEKSKDYAFPAFSELNITE